ncbi:hypothetical protein DFS34DRAFT_16394 [Phlyctochytrium arcticum]|nr:hypothetical protein DFS34DRAFT_16394 [Phlyctochytrium arcticum]
MMLKIHRGVGRPASILVVLFFIVALSNTIDAFPTRWLSRSFLRSDPTRKASQIGVTLIRRQTADGGQGLFSIGKRQQSQLLRPWESKSYKEHVQYHNKDSSQTSVDAENWKGVVDFTLKIFYAGFCAHLRLVNPGPDVSVSWRLHATLPPKAKLYTSWSGTYTEVLSNNVSTTTQQEWDVTPEDWNAAIVAGSSKTTGFCARFPSLKEQIDDVPVFDLVFSSNSGSGDDDGGNDGDDDEDCDDDDDNPATVTLIEPVPSSSVSPSLLPTAGPLSPFPNATPSSLPPGPVTPSPTRSPIVSIPSASPPNSVPSATPVVTSSPSLPTVVTPSTTPSATPSATPSVTPSATPATPSSASPSAPSTSPVPSSTTPPPSATPSPSIPASPTFVSPPATPTTTQRPIPTPPSNEGVDLTGLADTGRLLVGYWGQNVAL